MTRRDAVIYRPYEDRDAEGVMAIINDAFHIHRYTRRRCLERSALENYLDECLQGSSYARVAVLDGKVVGVVMGRVQGEPILPGSCYELLGVAVGGGEQNRAPHGLLLLGAIQVIQARGRQRDQH